MNFSRKPEKNWFGIGSKAQKFRSEAKNYSVQKSKKCFREFKSMRFESPNVFDLEANLEAQINSVQKPKKSILKPRRIQFEGPKEFISEAQNGYIKKPK